MRKMYKKAAGIVKILQKEMKPLLNEKTLVFISPVPVKIEEKMMLGVTFFKDDKNPRSVDECVASRIFYIPVGA